MRRVPQQSELTNKDGRLTRPWVKFLEEGGVVPDGGLTNEVLTKVSDKSQDLKWAPGGGGGGIGTVTHTGALTSGLPVIGNGAADITVGTKSGNTTEFATVAGAVTNGHVAAWDASGNLVDGGAPGATPSFSDDESPSGTQNGSNLAFTLGHSPTGSSLEVYLNGVLQVAGADYSLSGNTITFTYAPIVTDVIRCWYRY